jgi:hypothetical protein
MAIAGGVIELLALSELVLPARVPLRLASVSATAVSAIAVAKAIQWAAAVGKTLISTISQRPSSAVNPLRCQVAARAPHVFGSHATEARSS